MPATRPLTRPVTPRSKVLRIVAEPDGVEVRRDILSGGNKAALTRLVNRWKGSDDLLQARFGRTVTYTPMPAPVAGT